MELNEIYAGDCKEVLRGLPSESIDLVLTDPPYFIDGMGDDWNSDSISDRTARAGIVGSRPVGMKFDRQQGYKFQEFMAPVSEEVFRILRPGGFFVAFSQARLYHRLAAAIEDAGFEIRDMLAWKHEGQAKAFTQDHFIRKMKHLTDDQRTSILETLGGRKTPQLKPQIEPMAFAQKPRVGTFVENWLQYGVGLIDTGQTLDGGFPGTVMEVPKPSKSEREGNNHPTVKPLRLLRHLICLLTTPGQVVLDPFMGSGSTAVASVQAQRDFVGIELDESYVRLAKQRVEKARQQEAQRLDFSISLPPES